MSWYHVSDEDGHCSKCKSFSIFRCGHCRALAVCSQGEKPSGPCMKCKNKA